MLNLLIEHWNGKVNKIILLFLSTFSLYALEFHTFSQAIKIQEETKKTIMVYITRTGCHYCETMNKKVLQEEKMSQYLEKKFITVKLNLDRDLLLPKMHVEFTPTFYFLDKEQNILKRIPGSWNLEDFTYLIKDIK